MPEHLDVGQVLAGKYELLRLVGRGASSAVWAARHTSLGETFALKVLTPPPDVEPALASARFHEQAQVSASLSRKTRHVVSVTDHGEEDGWPYVVMELLEGETLQARLERGPVDPAETADILGQVARALTVAHGMNVFHGHLVPANMFLCRDEDGRVLVKLLEFGLARPGEPSAPPAEVIPEGDTDPSGEPIEVQRYAATTSPYASPEQVRGETVDQRCDLWALVVIGYECLTGTYPWGGDSVEDRVVAICTNQWIPSRERKPDLPYMVEAFFARGFAFELDDRFKTAKELAATFRAGFPHTGRAEGGRAAFASRPDFSDELGSVPKAKESTGALPATAAAPQSAPSVASAPPAKAEPAPAPKPASKPASEAPLAKASAEGATPTAPKRHLWVVLAVLVAVAVVASLALLTRS